MSGNNSQLIFEPPDTLESDADGRAIHFNSDLRRYLVMQEPTEDAFLQLVDEYEKLRLADALLSVAVPSKTTGLFVAWGSEHRGKPTNDQKAKGRVFFPLAYLDRHTNADRNGKGIYDFLRSLSDEDQLALLLRMTPKTRRDAESALSSAAFTQALPVNFRELVKKPYSFPSILSSLIRLAESEAQRDPSRARTREFIRHLTANNLILLPIGAPRELKGPILDGQDDPYIDQTRRAFLSQVRDVYKLRAAKTSYGPVLNRAKQIALSTSSVSAADVSERLLGLWEQGLIAAAEHSEPSTKTRSANVMHIRRTLELALQARKQALPSTPISFVLQNKRLRSGRWQGGRTEGFKWVLERNPALDQWVAVLSDYSTFQGSQVKQLKPVFQRLNIWCDFLLSHQVPPLNPDLVSRSEHISSSVTPKFTYLVHIEHELNSLKQRNAALATLSDFFEWHKRQLHLKGSRNKDSFSNPIHMDVDAWRVEQSAGITYRTALKDDQIELLKLIITKDDFSFCRNKERFKKDYVWVLDKQTGNHEETWFPGRARALLLMLDLPLRSFQVRWMDSGEGDEHIVTFPGATSTDQPSYSANPHRNRSANRKKGPFRLEVESDGATYVGLYIPTNKTADAFSKAEPGHTFPWVSEDVIANIRAMQDWQARYGFDLNEPVEAIETEDRTDRDYWQKVKVYPLFRDPSRTAKENPISRGRLSAFFYEALLEADKVYREIHPGLKPLVVANSQPREKGTFYKKYESEIDLHSLRVSGITNLLAANVPLDVVSRYFAGHHSLIMTLWYNKVELRRVRIELMRARDRMRQQQLPADELLISKLENGTSYGVRSAVAAERNSTWRIKIDGICPGTICNEGVIDAYGNPSPVPDSRCSLCRFHLTGPRFIFGNVLLINETIRKIHAREQATKKQQDELNEFVAKRLRGETIPPGDISSLEGSISKLKELQRLDLLDLAARKEAVEASRALLEGGHSKALAMRGDAETLKAVIRPGLHIENLHFLSLASEIIPGYSNPDAVRELREILEDTLSKNGVLVPLAGLSDIERMQSVNLMADLFLNHVREEDERLSILTGQLKLTEIAVDDRRTLHDVVQDLSAHIASCRRSGTVVTAEMLEDRLALPPLTNDSK